VQSNGTGALTYTCAATGNILHFGAAAATFGVTWNAPVSVPSITWNQLGQSPATGNGSADWWGLCAGTSSTSITETPTGGPTTGVAVAEFSCSPSCSGASTDAFANGPIEQSSAITLNMTTSQAGDLCLVSAFQDVGATLTTSTSGWVSDTGGYVNLFHNLSCASGSVSVVINYTSGQQTAVAGAIK
jgi:hypothetical protein